MLKELRPLKRLKLKFDQYVSEMGKDLIDLEVPDLRMEAVLVKNDLRSEFYMRPDIFFSTD